MKKLLPLLLILVIMGSGCTIPVLNIEIPFLPDIPGFGGPTIARNTEDVIIIKSLEAIPAEIDDQQTTRILTYVQNQGDKEREVAVTLYDYCNDLFAIQASSNCPGNKWSTIKKEQCNVTLVPGQIAPVSWNLKADLGTTKVKTICPPNGIKVSAQYTYSTPSLTTISFISQAELERTLEERSYKSTQSYISPGKGPIRPIITVEDKQPVPVFDGARTVLQLKILNVGSGNLVSKLDKTQVTDPDSVGLEGKQIEVTGIDTSSSNNMFVSDINDCLFADKTDPDWMKKDVKLIQKESSPIVCRVDISKIPVTRTATKHVTVNVKDYDYMVTKEVRVTVNPKISS
jgi:hypothetical protein